MDVSLQPVLDGEPSMTCPTCRAEQGWSGECRRCKCDLSDLRAVWRAGCHARQACLQSLADGDFARALYHARRYCSLQPGDDAIRLVAVTHLLRGEWLEACLATNASDSCTR
jgi:hypothetical protein